MATVFTRIIEGELPGTFVWRDEVCAAFLSINPLAPGHTLVVPIAEIDHWLDVPTDLQAHLFDVSRRIGEAQMRAFRPDRIGLVIAGFEVPHCHIHVPREFHGRHELRPSAADGLHRRAGRTGRSVARRAGCAGLIG